MKTSAITLVLALAATHLSFGTEALGNSENKSSSSKQNSFLTGHISQQLVSPAPGDSAYNFRPFKVIKTKAGIFLVGPRGDTRTTMIPYDFLDQTGAVEQGGAGGLPYTPRFAAQYSSRFDNKQVLGPMSVVHTGASLLTPMILVSETVMVNGIPHRVSGSMIMERPNLLQKKVAMQNRYVALKNKGSNRRTF